MCHLQRFLYACGGLTTVIGVRFDDIVYVPLPLYHSVAGMISLGAAMRTGITLVLKRKFSASSYWPDCVRYKVTVRERPKMKAQPSFQFIVVNIHVKILELCEVILLSVIRVISFGR